MITRQYHVAATLRMLYSAAGLVIAVAIMTMGVGAVLGIVVVAPVMTGVGLAPATMSYVKAWQTQSPR